MKLVIQRVKSASVSIDGHAHNDPARLAAPSRCRSR